MLEYGELLSLMFTARIICSEVSYIRAESEQATQRCDEAAVGSADEGSTSSVSVYGTKLPPMTGHSSGSRGGGTREGAAPLSAYPMGVAENTALAAGRGRVAEVYRTIKSKR